jgi:hypothetical protein
MKLNLPCALMIMVLIFAGCRTTSHSSGLRVADSGQNLTPRDRAKAAFTNEGWVMAQKLDLMTEGYQLSYPEANNALFSGLCRHGSLAIQCRFSYLFSHHYKKGSDSKMLTAFVTYNETNQGITTKVANVLVEKKLEDQETVMLDQEDQHQLMAVKAFQRHSKIKAQYARLARNGYELVGGPETLLKKQACTSLVCEHQFIVLQAYALGGSYLNMMVQVELNSEEPGKAIVTPAKIQFVND